MSFILRAFFWLAVVSALLPARTAEEPGLGEQAGRMVGAAMDYCARNPADCIGSAQATAEALRIPAELFARAQNYKPAAPAVPQPEPRPASL